MSFRRGRGAWFFPSTSSMRPPPSWKLINYLYHLMFSPFLSFFRCRSSCFSSHRYPYSCYPMHERMNNKNGVKGFDDLNVGNKRNVLIPFFNRLSSRGPKVTYRVGTRSQVFLLRKGWFCCVRVLILLRPGFQRSDWTKNDDDHFWGPSTSTRLD